MYDSLLDELEDDVVARPREVEELGDKVAEAEEAEAICNSMTVCDSNWLYDPDYDPKKVGPVTK